MHRKRGRSARASLSPHHTLDQERTARFTTRPFSALVRRRANARNVSFRISLRWTIHIINPVDNVKLLKGKYNALRLVLKQRHDGTRKWPSDAFLVLYTNVKLHISFLLVAKGEVLRVTFSCQLAALQGFIVS